MNPETQGSYQGFTYERTYSAFDDGSFAEGQVQRHRGIPSTGVLALNWSRADWGWIGENGEPPGNGLETNAEGGLKGECFEHLWFQMVGHWRGC